MKAKRHGTARGELGSAQEPDESESSEQSGDSLGLPQVADESGESVEELAESGQTFEAELLEGVEDAADHPEKPLHTREDQSRIPELPPVRGSD